MATIRDHLSPLTLFSNLSEKHLAQVCQNAELVKLGNGDHLFEQGDQAGHFFYLIDGQIKLSRISMDGAEKVIEVIAPQHCFAEAVVFNDIPCYPVAAEAIGKSNLIRIDSKIYKQALRGSVDTCLSILSDFSRRINGLIVEIDHITLQSAPCRVASYILAHVPQGHSEYDLGVSKYILASRLNIKPETFSRILKKLSAIGLIKVEGNHVHILDLQQLRTYCESCAVDNEGLQAAY